MIMYDELRSWGLAVIASRQVTFEVGLDQNVYR